MYCRNCGTEIARNAKFCPKCGAAVPAGRTDNGNAEDKHRTDNKSAKCPRNIFSKHPKLIFFALTVVVATVLFAIFKYMALVPIIILLVLFAVIMINRRILRKIKGKDSQEIAQCALADNEINKLTQYFVNRDEKYISSLGNGYIMNYLASGSLSRGFAVISNKRVYFRGSCFSGQGKSLVKTDEERTVDIKDVTGSGFIYRRYIGVLLGLFIALAVLLSGIARCTVFLANTWDDTKDYQNKANELQNTISDIGVGDTKINEFTEQINENQTSIEKLQAELSELQTQKSSALTETVSNSIEYLTGTELNTAYGEYRYELYEIAEKSEIISLLCNLFEKIHETYFYDYNHRLYSLEDICEDEDIWSFFNLPSPVWDGVYNVYGYIETPFLSITDPAYLAPEYIYALCGIDIRLVLLSYQSVDCYTYNEIMRLWDDILGMAWTDVGNTLATMIPAEDTEACRTAYEHFLEKVAPDYLDSETPPTWAEIASNYLILHPDASFANMVDFSGITAEYDSQISKLNKEIADLNNSNLTLETEIEKWRDMQNDLSTYERDYEAYTKKAFSSFSAASFAAIAAGLLITFLISCFLVFLNYLKKRKTMFQIQYAGGCIAFNVSYYAKAEIDDFQKQLRRAKDLAEESTAKVTVSESPIQPSTQNSTPDDLRKYADLLKDGLISQEEYDAMKKKILNL